MSRASAHRAHLVGAVYAFCSVLASGLRNEEFAASRDIGAIPSFASFDAIFLLLGVICRKGVRGKIDGDTLTGNVDHTAPWRPLRLIRSSAEYHATKAFFAIVVLTCEADSC